MIEPPDEAPRREHPIPDESREEMISLPSRCTLDDFLNWCLTEGVPPEALLHGGQLSWVREATPTETAQRLQWRAEADARHEVWERAKYEELHAKYGGAR